ncbi:hypothetical protein BD324DRAFT_146477 [Kockovaella imperatae]|uniref:Uncharacterized protein n=1 Tax=Kockovaella imperatae TaxID=4999 RepID=A0A1Y1UA62_9TREE|nr:hypothetical protein BD324DRAFT_146477 [Kockovaella imperatae]ORX34396.1 hypothetical protein BD324DRAFT_146477 [Kockovaella imperatae]
MAKPKPAVVVDKDTVSVHSHLSNSPPSQHHHHDHEHHHTHSHYEREVQPDGTVIEKTITEEIKETPAGEEGHDPSSQEEKGGAGAGAGLSKTQRKKANKKAREAAAAALVAAAEAEKAVEEAVAVPTTVVPGSPTHSHRSHHTHHSDRSHRSHHHHPEIIVNVNAAPAVAPVAPLFEPHNIPLPASRAPTVVPSSPTASVRSMRLPKTIFSKGGTAAPLLVQPIPEAEEENVMEVAPGDEVVTKVITTTTTTRRPATPPEEIAIPMVMDPSKGIVENDPSWKYTPPKAGSVAPPPPPAPPTPPAPELSPPRGSPQRFVETTTVETVSYPIHVDTSATTLGNATTKGLGAARSALLTTTSGGRTGTKAGLKPISLVDHDEILRASPVSRKKALSLPAPEPVPLPALPDPPRVPQTVATMSAHLDVDSRGNEHLHARLRDHTGVVKDVEEMTAAPTHYTSSKGRRYRIIEEIPEDKVFSPSQSWKTRGAGKYKIIEEMDTAHKTGKRYKIVEEIVDGRDREEDDDTPSQTRGDKKKHRRPVYRPLSDAAPPPKSERYAYPPAPTDIAKNAKERFWNRFGMGGQRPDPPMPGPGGPAIGGYGGYVHKSHFPSDSSSPAYPPLAPYPTPGPMTMPAPTPLMGSRPPMFGPPMMNPMLMGMGTGEGGGHGMGGMGGAMGLMGMPMPRMGMPYAPVAGMGYGMMPGYGGRF